MFVTVHAEDMELQITGDRRLLGWQTPGAAGPATYGSGTAENPVGETDWRMEEGAGFNNTIIARPSSRSSGQPNKLRWWDVMADLLIS